MEPIYRHTFQVTDHDVDCHGRLRPSLLLYYAQEIAGRHCQLLGLDWDSMASRRQFWAIIRQKTQITRLPVSGETITVETWPMPTTRVAYPRSTVGYDAEGNELFRSIALWVIMDLDTRAMILPGKSGVEVSGTLTGSELAAPNSLLPRALANRDSRHVRFSQLDRNGHMNNTRYMDWVEDLLPSAFHKEHPVKEFTVCYLNEATEGQRIDLNYQLLEDGILQVDAHREKTDDPGQYDRVFSARMVY